MYSLQKNACNPYPARTIKESILTIDQKYLSMEQAQNKRASLIMTRMTSEEITCVVSYKLCTCIGIYPLLCLGKPKQSSFLCQK